MIRPLTVAAAVAMALGGKAMPVWSADDTAKSNASLEEIVVTATRRAQKVQEIPFNISAISGEDLEKANINDSVEALRSVAGVSMIDRGYRSSGISNGIVIRGINVDTAAQGDVPLAAPPTVATYVDNTALFGNFVLKDIDRVEVLRGPQSTLYGSGSLAGNVRYIMTKPDLHGFSGKVSMGYGVTAGSAGDNLNPDLTLNVPLGDTFAVRANIGQIKNAGVVDYPNVYVLDAHGDPVVTNGDIVNAKPVYRYVHDADTVDIKYGRISAYFKPNELFNAQLSYQKQKDDIGARRQVTEGVNLVNGGSYADYQFGGIQLEPSHRDVDLTALELELSLGFATLTSSTSHYSHSGNSISDNSGVYARNGWFAYYGSSPRPIAQAQRFYDDSANTEELRLVSNGRNFIDWTAGLYLTDQSYSLGQNSYLVGYVPYMNAINLYGLAPFSTNQDFLFRRNQDYKEWAVYGEATFNLQDNLHLTVGGRYFDNKVDVNAIVDVPIYSSPTNPPGTAAQNLSDNSYLLKANLAWDLSAHSMVYATFSQGYRHAGANAVPTSGKYAESPGYFTFDSDSVNNYELGFKGTTPTLAYSISAYYQDWRNPQLNTATSNWGFFAVINGQSARTQGIELELSGKLTDQLNFNLGYTYADAELTADVYQPAGNFFGSGVLYTDRIAADGERLPGSAKNVLSASLTHHLNLSHGLELTTVLSGYYQSSTLNSLGDNNCLTSYNAIGNCRDSPNPASGNYAPASVFSRAYAQIGSFQIWNLSATLSKSNWDASLYAKNLFNEAGTTGVFPYLLGGSQPDASQNYFGNNSRSYIAQPRTFGVVVGFKF